jgi:hypothetical protein
MAERPEIEIDAQKGQRALLYVRTPDGQDWIAAAILSDLTPIGPETLHSAPRPVSPGEDMQLVNFVVVLE